MPTLETLPTAPPPPPPDLPKVAAGRYGELDHSEIVHLLSSLDDEVARSRFRESIYISLIICLALAWFAFYGPRVLFHQGRIINIPTSHKKELSYLEIPPDLKKIIPPPKNPTHIADQNAKASTRNPSPTPEPPRALIGHPNPPAPLPPTPQPQPRPQQQQPQPQQQQPQPRPQQQPQLANIPDAPRPTPQPTNRPIFNQPPSDPGASISQAARDAARQSGGQSGEGGSSSSTSRRTAAQAQVEILSDTLGTDFGPYIRRLVRTTENAWSPLIPEECREPLFKTGQTLIRFTIDHSGAIIAMHLDDSTHDVAIDKSAWGSLTSQGQLPPLPTTFKGPTLELRFHFIVGRAGSATE